MKELYLSPCILLLAIASTIGYKWETWAEEGSFQQEKPETVDGYWDPGFRVRRGSKRDKQLTERKRNPWSGKQERPVTLDKYDFDYLGFAQHYGPTVCFKKKVDFPQWNCLPEDKWTIHGLWPLGDGDYLKNCDDSKKIAAGHFKPYERALGRKWTNLYSKQGNTRDPYSFWRYQWMKHGTCVGGSPKLNSFDKYFQQALGLFDKYQMSKVFRRVLQGDNPDRYLQAIREAFQKNGRVTCYSYKDKQYIRQIEICLNKDTLEIFDCPWPLKRLCDSEKPVLYPSWEELNIELNRGRSPKGWAA